MPGLLLAESRIQISEINKNFYQSVRNNIFNFCLVDRLLRSEIWESSRRTQIKFGCLRDFSQSGQNGGDI